MILQFLLGDLYANVSGRDLFVELDDFSGSEIRLQGPLLFSTDIGGH